MVVSALAKVRQDSTKFGLEADWGSILDEGDPPARGPTGKETPSSASAFGPTLDTQPPPPDLPRQPQPLLHQPSVGYFAAPSVGNVAAPNEMQQFGLSSHVQMQAMFPQLASHGFFPSPSFHQPLPAIIPSPNTGFVGFGGVPYAAASSAPNFVSSPSNALDAATDLDAQVKDALDCDEGAAAAFEPPMPPRKGGRVSSQVTPTQAGKKQRNYCIPSNGAPGRGRAPSDPTPNKKAAAVPNPPHPTLSTPPHPIHSTPPHPTLSTPPHSTPPHPLHSTPPYPLKPTPPYPLLGGGSSLQCPRRGDRPGRAGERAAAPGERGEEYEGSCGEGEEEGSCGEGM